MWQDYVGLVPTVGAAVVGVIALLTPEMARWKKILAIICTVIAIGATGFSQWWTLHQKTAEDAARADIREQLGRFIAEGEALMPEVVSNPTNVPEDRVNDWAKRAEAFLGSLGPSYVVRFRSDAGMPIDRPTGLATVQQSYWLGIRARVVRLNEFMAEFSK